MIYFIKKTISEEQGVVIESQYFASIEKLSESISNRKSITPDFIVSNSMKMFDVTYENATLIVTEEKDLKIVVDIIIHGISGKQKSDEFVINTIKDIHRDKIKATSIDNKAINATEMIKMIDECRDKCLSACASGISSNKKIVMEFFELKSSLGLNNQHGNL